MVAIALHTGFAIHVALLIVLRGTPTAVLLTALPFLALLLFVAALVLLHLVAILTRLGPLLRHLVRALAILVHHTLPGSWFGSLQTCERMDRCRKLELLLARVERAVNHEQHRSR